MPAENLRSGLENVQKKKSGETYGNINLGVPSVTEVSRHGFRGEPRIKAFAKEPEKESELMENNESPIDKPKTINDLEKLYVRQTLHDKFNLVSDQHQLSEIGEKRQKAKDRAMITLKTEMTIPNVSPDEFFLALLTLDDPIYKAMAPKQHIKFEIIDEKDRIDGTTYHFHEKVGELDINEKMRITNINDTDEKKYIAQRSIGKLIPIELHHTLEKVPEGTKLTWELHIGRKFGGLEKPIKWYAEKFKLTPEQKKIQQEHAQEEFLELGRIIQRQAQDTSKV